MYYICKFRSKWLLFEDSAIDDIELKPEEIKRIMAFFPGILEDRLASAGLRIGIIPPNKVLQPVQPQQYLICQLFSLWLIHDGKKKADRLLTDEEIVWIKKLVPNLIAKPENALNLQVTAISTTKVLQLSSTEKGLSEQKTPGRSPEPAGNT